MKGADGGLDREATLAAINPQMGVLKTLRACLDDSFMPIFVKMLDTPGLCLVVKASDSIGHVKMMIEDKWSIFAGHQLLIFAGRALAEDGKTLTDCNITKEATLHLMHRLSDPKPFLGPRGDASSRLFVRISHATGSTSVRSVSLDVRGTTTLAELKALIHAREGIPPEKQRLRREGRDVRKADGTLDELQIGREINLIVRQ
uniref:Ubiquitin-like domain-containing protein n=1 Tax=Calcidiscus leptoporus TaxID=127549 RepID=A0A7S0INL7_9EUKA